MGLDEERAARGRVALVTGGSQGIGAAVVRRLARAGADVVVAARGVERSEALAAELCAEGVPGRVVALGLDVTDARATARVPERVAELLGGRAVEWLVNNAGAAVSVPFARSGDELFDELMAVNFHGARRLMAALLPGMLAAGGGRVVNVASSAGLRGYAYVAAYCAAKHALVGLTRATALELEPKGVVVRALCPHYVDTPLLQASIERVMQKTGQTQAEARAFFAAENPGGRLVTPEQVAGAALFACLAPLDALPACDPILELDGSEPALPPIRT